MRSEFGARTAVALFFLALGCGTGAPSPEEDPPLLTLRGVLTNDPHLSLQNAQVALVWRQATLSVVLSEGVAQPVPVRAEFPFRFELDLHRLPPEESMTPRSAYGRAALGTILVYADQNENGTLDLLPDGALQSESIDRVLGTPSELSLLYVEGAGAVPGGPTSGFHLLRSSPPVPLVYPPLPRAPNMESPSPTLLPVTQEFTVPLTADPQLAVHMCRGFTLDDGNSGGSSCGGSDCPFYDVPEGAKVRCTPDGRAFTSELCPPEGTLCARNGCTFGSGTWTVGAPRPRGWPCP